MASPDNSHPLVHFVAASQRISSRQTALETLSSPESPSVSVNPHRTNPGCLNPPSSPGLTANSSLHTAGVTFGAMLHSSYQGSVSAGSYSSSSALERESMKSCIAALMGMGTVTGTGTDTVPPMPLSVAATAINTSTISESPALHDDKTFSMIGSGIGMATEGSTDVAAGNAAPPPTPAPLFELVSFKRRSTAVGGSSQVVSLDAVDPQGNRISTTLLTANGDGSIEGGIVVQRASTSPSSVKPQQPLPSNSTSALRVSVPLQNTSSSSSGGVKSDKSSSRLVASSSSNSVQSSEPLISMMSLHSSFIPGGSVSMSSTQQSSQTVPPQPSQLQLPVAHLGTSGNSLRASVSFQQQHRIPSVASFSVAAPHAPTHRLQAVTFDIPSSDTTPRRPLSTSPTSQLRSSVSTFQFQDADTLLERHRQKREAHAHCLDNSQPSKDDTAAPIFAVHENPPSTSTTAGGSAAAKNDTVVTAVDDGFGKETASSFSLLRSINCSSTASTNRTPKDVIDAVGGREKFIERIKALYA